VGYESTFSGKIAIDPPLSKAECDQFPLSWTEASATIAVRESTGSTEIDGVPVDVDWTSRTGVAIRVRRGEERGYHLEAELRALAQAYSSHVFDGWIVRVGAEIGDVQRYTVRDGGVITERAQLTWPDGSPVVT